MLVVINAALTIVPFVVICIAVRCLMKRKNVELSDVQRHAGENRRARKVFLLGFWRNEE